MPSRSFFSAEPSTCEKSERRKEEASERERGKANNRVFAGISLPIYSRINTKTLSFHDEAIKAVFGMVVARGNKKSGREIKDDDDFCLPLHALIIVAFYEHNFFPPMSLCFSFCASEDRNERKKIIVIDFLFPQNEWMDFYDGFSDSENVESNSRWDARRNVLKFSKCFER